MKREVENIPASIQARLKNKATESQRPLNELLQYYGMERFLYRLSKTQHVNNLILKGGLMFYGLEIPMRRTTRDIDFLGISENLQSDILSVLREAISVPSPEDGVQFDAATLRLSRSQADENQGGIRITFVGYLGKTRMPIQVDVGFSDELASDALDMDYPVLLAGMEKPRLRGYPPESIISEKFHAIVRFAEANSRWKDYYDIDLLADTFEFEGRALVNAMKSTFDNRPSKLTDQVPYGLRAEFASANQENWEAFLKKSNLQNDSPGDLNAVINRIWRFLEYPLREMQSGKQGKSKHWTRDTGWE